MSEAITDLWLGFGYCVFMLALAALFRWKFPNKINYIFGYRTRRSMLNETIWKASNLYAANFFVKISLFCFLFPPILYFITPGYVMMITCIISLFLISLIVYFTENYIRRNFDDDGNPL